MVQEFTPEGIERMLCVVAHPDDMEYGASAAVAMWTSRGVEVTYLLLTAGEAGIRDLAPNETRALRTREQQHACDIVGATDLVILDFPDGLLEHSVELRAAIAEQIRRAKPQAVMATDWALEVPWGLNHVDHRAVGLATVDAIRDADNPWIFPEAGQAWATTWLLVTGAESTHVIELDEDAVRKGIDSLNAHEAYLAALPDHPPAEDIVGGAAAGGAELARAAGLDFQYALGVRAIQMG